MNLPFSSLAIAVYCIVSPTFLLVRTVKIDAQTENSNKNDNLLRLPLLFNQKQPLPDKPAIQPTTDATPSTTIRPECVVDDPDVLAYVCPVDGSTYPPRFAFFPLTAELGATEVIRHFNSSFTDPAPVPVSGPTEVDGTAHHFSQTGLSNTYLQVDFKALEWETSWFDKFSMTFYFFSDSSSNNSPLVISDDRFNIWYYPENETIIVNAVCGSSNFAKISNGCPVYQWNFVAVAWNGPPSYDLTFRCNNETAEIINDAFCSYIVGNFYIGKGFNGTFGSHRVSCLSLYDRYLTDAEIELEKALCKYHFYDKCTCSE